MLVDGSQPDSVEHQVLLVMHRAGAAVEYRNPSSVTWSPREDRNIGKAFKPNTMYRLAGDKNDSQR